MKKYQYLASWDDQTLTRVGEPVVVLGDSNVSQVEVTLPSDFLLDPTKAECRMYFLLPGEKESAHDVLETAVKDDNGDSHVTWTIKHAHTQKGGRLAFSLTLIGDDAQWDSRTAIIPVYESRYQPESEEAEELYTGRLDALEGSMASIRGEFAEVQEDFEDLKETATLGTPIPESLVANMQEGHVYIYTGTEPGYTAGHVYYYVGGALTDGGVYGGTAVDTTLTQSGQAADAKVTGDKIAEIKEDLSDYNSIDIIPLFSTYTNRTVYGITFTFSEDKKSCIANGTASGAARTYLFRNQEALPNEMIQGKTYRANVESTSTNLYLYFSWYNSGGSTLYNEAIGYNKIFTVPKEAVGLALSIAVSSGKTVTNDRITFEILNADTNRALQNNIENVAENTRRGRTLTISQDDIISGSYNSRGEVVTNSARVRTNDFIKTYAGEELFFSPGTKACEMLIGYFDGEKNFIKDSQWITTESHIAMSNGYILIVFRTSADNVNIVPSDYDANTYIIADWRVDIDSLMNDTGNNIPSYYFDNNYLPSKADEVNQIGLNLSRKSGRWAFITDYHSDANAGHSPALIRYLIKKCGIGNTVFNGDAITRYDSEIAAYNKLCEFIDSFNPVAEISSMYYVTGNHEYNNSDLQHSEHEISKSALFMLFNDPLKDAVCLENTNSFYVDDDNAKIRYYFVDCERGSLIAIATIKSVLKSAENIPDGYAVVIFSHTGLTADNSAIIDRFALIMGGFKALNDSQNYTYDGVTYTYSSGSDRTFVGAITGHTHLEGHIIYDSRFPVITVPCDCYKAPQQVSHPERVAGTILEQAFEILQIDVDAKRIYLTRIGWGNNRTFSFGEGAGLVT